MWIASEQAHFKHQKKKKKNIWNIQKGKLCLNVFSILVFVTSNNKKLQHELLVEQVSSVRKE